MLSNKPKILDMCCGGGGAGMGYHMAGFEVTGVDIKPQPRYPFRFVQADALEYAAAHWQEYVFIHASPPCQFASELTPKEYRANHPNLIPAIRALLLATGLPYVIENVAGARKHLVNPVMLCGSMFGLTIWRHRYFENNFGLWQSPHSCNHNFIPILVSGESLRLTPPVLISGRGMRKVEGLRRHEDSADVKRAAMCTPWMTEAECTQAIPPAYTNFIGRYLLQEIAHADRAAVCPH